MAYLKYTHIAYFVLTWAFAFIVLKPRRVFQLLPVAVLSMVVLALSDQFVISLRLYQFNKPIVNVMGMPLFHILWAGAAGMVFIHFSNPGFGRKLVNLLFFTLITLVLEYIAEKAGVASRLGSYNILHSAFIDFSVLTVLLLFSEGLYGQRIYQKPKKHR